MKTTAPKTTETRTPPPNDLDSVRWWYVAELVRVIDGDTVVLDVDLGFRTQRGEVFRLVGIDTPELHGVTPQEREAAQAAKIHLEELIQRFQVDGTSHYPRLVIRTRQNRTDKYGRWLVDLWGWDKDQPINLNQRMVDDGHAIVWGTETPW